MVSPVHRTANAVLVNVNMISAKSNKFDCHKVLQSNKVVVVRVKSLGGSQLCSSNGTFHMLWKEPENFEVMRSKI